MKLRSPRVVGSGVLGRRGFRLGLGNVGTGIGLGLGVIFCRACSLKDEAGCWAPVRRNGWGP